MNGEVASYSAPMWSIGRSYWSCIYSEFAPKKESQENPLVIVFPQTEMLNASNLLQKHTKQLWAALSNNLNRTITSLSVKLVYACRLTNLILFWYFITRYTFFFFFLLFFRDVKINVNTKKPKKSFQGTRLQNVCSRAKFSERWALTYRLTTA